MTFEKFIEKLKLIRKQIRTANTLIETYVPKGSGLMFKDITGQLRSADENVCKMIIGMEVMEDYIK